MTDAAAAPTDLEHAMEVEAWRRERYERLRQRMSWLTLVGLDWLRPGENRIGTDPTNDVVLPAGAPTAGRLVVEHRLQALPGGDAGELWLIFADATNGAETYAGGRYLYTAAPRGGRVVVDLNRAYNPP